MFNDLKSNWTRVVTYALIIAFGCYSVVQPIVSVDRASPTWATTLLGSEFAVAGLLLLLGMGRRRGLRFIGLVVVCLGLFTISFIIAFVGGFRVLAYAFLFAAFAMDCVHDIRVERRAGKSAPEELSRLLEELKAADRERNGS